MDVLMPQLGETVAEGTVSTWHKREGDRVEADEILLDVETDKVSMEIPAPSAGILKRILVEEGATVDVGTVLAVIETDQDAQSTADSSPAEKSEEAAPSFAEAAEVASQSVATSSAGSAPAEREAAPAVAAGGLEVPAWENQSSPRPLPRQSGALRLSPAVRRLVAQHAIDVGAVPGTGRNGRVTRRDVLRFLDRGPAAQAATRPAAVAAIGAEIQPFSRIRKLTAEHMVRSKATSPHVLQAVEVDFARVDRARAAAREAWRAKHGYSLTYLPFIAHAVCTALREFPNVNASVQGEGLALHPHVNLAIAVDLGAEGLVAPVIRRAERLSVAELARAIHDISSRAREGKLVPDDLAGGTYTLSNSGTFGTLITAPIINQPQVAILSVDGVRKRPVVIEAPEGDVIAIRPVGILAQSFDHRAFDGAYSAAFLHRVRALLEQSEWSVEP